MTTATSDELSDRLLAWNDGLGWVNDKGPLIGAAIIELSGGQPVEPSAIAGRRAGARFSPGARPTHSRFRR